MALSIFLCVFVFFLFFLHYIVFHNGNVVQLVNKTKGRGQPFTYIHINIQIITPCMTL